MAQTDKIYYQFFNTFALKVGSSACAGKVCGKLFISALEHFVFLLHITSKSLMHLHMHNRGFHPQSLLCKNFVLNDQQTDILKEMPHTFHTRPFQSGTFLVGVAW